MRTYFAILFSILIAILLTMCCEVQNDVGTQSYTPSVTPEVDIFYTELADSTNYTTTEDTWMSIDITRADIMGSTSYDGDTIIIPEGVYLFQAFYDAESSRAALRLYSYTQDSVLAYANKGATGQLIYVLDVNSEEKITVNYYEIDPMTLTNDLVPGTPELYFTRVITKLD